MTAAAAPANMVFARKDTEMDSKATDQKSHSQTKDTAAGFPSRSHVNKGLLLLRPSRRRRWRVSIVKLLIAALATHKFLKHALT